MNTEIEIKVEIEECKYNNILNFMRTNAVALSCKAQEDIYYSPETEDYYDKGDRCLRIRIEGNKQILSYKQIHMEAEKGQYIEEYETELSDSKMTERILEKIEFPKGYCGKKISRGVLV